MFVLFKKRNLDDMEFVRVVVDEAREAIISDVKKNWPPAEVPSLEIMYCRYDWKRLMRSWILLEDYAYKRNFKVEVIKENGIERCIKYTYLFYSPMKVK